MRTKVIGHRKYFSATSDYPLFNDINNIFKKFVGIDKIIERITTKIGKLQAVYVSGDFAKGRDSKIIDLVVVGAEFDILNQPVNWQSRGKL